MPLPPQASQPDWRVLARSHQQGHSLPVHSHQSGQLVFALCGSMQVDTGFKQWTIPPQRALWLPPQQEHGIQMLSDVALRTVYFSPAKLAACPQFARQGETHVLVASSLVRELVQGLFVAGRSLAMQNMMAGLLLHALSETACLPSDLPWPAPGPLRLALQDMLRAGQWQRPMDELAAQLAMSGRSFSRHFSAQTDMSFRHWRQRARLIASLDLLASTASIKSIAHRLQFASSAAYVSAFKELMGTSPQVFRQALLAS
ncbi:AraC family transcriptional regulator [Undibacterium sp. JH2W]|uniref:AraC family transcriptional regulator n=1 Tax=Undibacterium sp. JH2W TaxID=3413037 RepID=UPI003BF2EDEC